MGGKTHVTFKCCNFLLIPSNKVKEEKSQCNVKRFTQGNNTEVHILPIYIKKESFICSDVNYQMRVCNKCHKNFPEDNITIIIPECEDIDDFSVHKNDSDNFSSYGVQNKNNLLLYDDHTLDGEKDELEQFIENYVTFSN